MTEPRSEQEKPNGDDQESLVDFASIFGPTEKLDESLKQSFGLSRSPVDSLLNDDDWAFVVKMHGYVEAALNQILIAHFGNPKLDAIVHKLETGHEKRGKLAFIKALGLLPTDACLFVKLISELRGTVTHEIRWIEINLSKYFQDLDDGQKSRWKTGFSFCWHFKSSDDTILDMAVAYPRHAIFMCVMAIMTMTVIQKLRGNAQRSLDKWLRHAGESWSSQHKIEVPRLPNSNPESKDHQQ